MHIIIPDDYQGAVRHLDCFAMLAGHQVTIYTDHTEDVEELATRFQSADALILLRERTPITEPLLRRLPGLRLIVQTGRQAPHLDLDACKQYGITVLFTEAAVSAAPTAELTWSLVLASRRFLVREVASMQAGHWQSTVGTALQGQTLGVFGYGRIGSLVASYGRAFGMQVQIWGREHSLAEARKEGFTLAASQDELFEQADVLCLHVKLGAETRGIVTAAHLARMKPTALFVNTSRAALVEAGALEAALRAGRPGYAAVDVYEHEPVKDHPLLHMEQVLCTPHLGYVERATYEEFFRGAFEQVVAFVANRATHTQEP
jgi:D-3-phosphoglycerate dehydrogenase